ncbi:hypothetical protein Pmar_PMAR001749 [Perkinsus marinus ATCC 50983]|uniref:Uncharacterized protein n=1 Tax=Perkinsus marinus (strain ATCC 50983 / TXsc) TaxID=423536 RepID=C5LFT4_PERM5|nr:hypothetical protein Pmar_PMAR001749 [Perkinsus marinus ATCC 50983]EER04409.1 hypothetical protein Pmar_PMAR001749 [Perkinsus marinus ATCC 50983]|eukprot:XP_002772593.1 hypothetical protein Pmar_PMAR001749 [Perkinsus marinus ATCC 50983]
MKVTVQEYVDAWKLKQAALRERSIKDTPQDYQLALYDLVYISECADHSLGGHLSLKWRGPLTIAKLCGTSMVYLFDGIVLPSDYGGNLKVSDDKTTLEGGPGVSSLIYASVKNLVPARALQSLIYDHYEKGLRVYQDMEGNFDTFPASDESDNDLLVTINIDKKTLPFCLVVKMSL